MNPVTDWVSIDVETVGDVNGYALQPWRAMFNQARVRTYSVSWIGDGKLMHRSTDVVDRYLLSQFLLSMAKQNKTLVTWKGTFDIAWFVAMGLVEEVHACKWLDAMVLWKNLDRNRNSYSLKEAVRLYLPQYANYEEGIDFEGDVTKLLKYNETDTDVTLLLALKFWGELTPRERNALLIDMEDLSTIAERNVKGLEINLHGLQKTAGMLSAQRAENLAKLSPHLETIGDAVAKGKQINPAEMKKRFKFWDKKDPERLNKVASLPYINLDSDAQVAKLIFEDWGLPVYKYTDGGSPSVDKEVLQELAHEDVRASWLQKYRETTGLLSKCVKAVAISLQYNNPYPGFKCENIVRPEQNKSGTVTDRCTYSSNIKTGKRGK